MRPYLAKLVCLLALVATNIATSQENNRVAPTIHNGLPQVPHPPINSGNYLGTQDSGAENRAPSAYASNAGWLGTPQAIERSPVITAAASESIATTRTATRTPLDPPTAKPSDSSERGGGSTLKMLLSVGSSLLIVLGLFLGVAWFARKTMNTTFGGLPKQVVSILGRTPLAPRQQLVLVRFGSKLVLVSMIQGEARTISEITDPLEVDQIAGLCESQQPGSITNSFRSILHQSGGGAV